MISCELQMFKMFKTDQFDRSRVAVYWRTIPEMVKGRTPKPLTFLGKFQQIFIRKCRDFSLVVIISTTCFVPAWPPKLDLSCWRFKHPSV